jgi:integrase
VQEKELSYLTQEQIVELLDAAAASTNEDLELICRIALATGARWSEAEGLRVSQIHQRRIQYAQTKSGRVRTVPISEELEKAIRAHAKRKARGERIFGTAYAAFRKAIERAKIELPAGQLSHVLRHSFASHFMMNGGNILTLQKILGHSDLKTTMRYAHMAPDHLEEAVALNPVANVAMKPR